MLFRCEPSDQYDRPATSPDLSLLVKTGLTEFLFNFGATFFAALCSPQNLPAQPNIAIRKHFLALTSTKSAKFSQVP
jgi:hypothetical protein